MTQPNIDNELHQINQWADPWRSFLLELREARNEATRYRCDKERIAAHLRKAMELCDKLDRPTGNPPS
jgi:hypothetical protein